MIFSLLPGIIAALITSTFGIVITIIIGWNNMSKTLAIFQERIKTLEKNNDVLFDKMNNHDEKLNGALEKIYTSINELRILIEQNKNP